MSGFGGIPQGDDEGRTRHPPARGLVGDLIAGTGWGVPAVVDSVTDSVTGGTVYAHSHGCGCGHTETDSAPAPVFIARIGTRQCRHLWLLLDAFERHRDRVAFVRDGRPTTYGEARAEVFRLAQALSAYGLRRGDGVAVLAGNTPATLLAPLAAQLLGCYYTGIAPVLPPQEQARLIEDTQAAVLLFDPATEGGKHAAPLLEQVRIPTVLSLGPSAVGEDLSARAARYPADPVLAQGTDDDLAELVYTSGSTGRPKAAGFTFRGVGALAAYWADESRLPTVESAVFGAADCRMLWAGPFIRLSAPTVVPMLLNGGTSYVLDEFEPGEVLRTIERESITVTMMTPTQLYRLLDHPDLPRTDLSSLRLLVYHSAAAAPAKLAQAVRKLGPVLLGSYGQTEAKMIAALGPEDHAAGRQRPELLRSAGRPRRGVEVEIRDEHGRALDAGEIGEVCVRSPLIMDGYWHQPELTAQVIVDGWVQTRDVGYLDQDGYLFLLDRLRDLVIVDGGHCYTLPIEDVLTGHPAVERAAVVGLPDERSGEAIHAAVVLRPHARVTAEVLRALVRERKDAAHEPKTIAFVDDIPLTPAGKPDKNAVRRELARRRDAGSG